MTTSVFGVIGWPIGHSASPAMMNAAFSHMGIDATYVSFAVKPTDVLDALRGVVALGVRGINVTIPHKQAVAKAVDVLSEEARLTGAVNTVRVDSENGRLFGHNTDIVGWWTSISEHVANPRGVVTVLGAGGACRAILAAIRLNRPNWEIRLVSRRVEQAMELVSMFDSTPAIVAIPWEERHDAVRTAQMVVNTTPIGMWPHPLESPIDEPSCLGPNQVVSDLVYRPLETRFLQQAREAGATAVDGLWMLVNQGKAAVEYWLSQEPDGRIMRSAALAFLGERK